MRLVLEEKKNNNHTFYTFAAFRSGIRSVMARRTRVAGYAEKATRDSFTLW